MRNLFKPCIDIVFFIRYIRYKLKRATCVNRRKSTLSSYRAEEIRVEYNIV